MSNQTTARAFDQGTLPEQTFDITCMYCGAVYRWTRPEGTAKCMEAFFPNCCPGQSCGPYSDAPDSVVDQHLAYWRSIVPARWLDTVFPRLPDPVAAETVVNWQYGCGGLLLLGPSGSGKTRSVCLLLRRLCEEGRRPVAFSPTGFGHEVAENCRGHGAKTWAKALGERDLIFFDDLCKDRLTDRVEAELFGIIDARIANLKPTIITTNMTGETMKGVMSNDRAVPLIRRLREEDYFTQVTFRIEGEKP